jgi:hypothetical protein
LTFTTPPSIAEDYREDGRPAGNATSAWSSASMTARLLALSSTARIRS